MTRSNGAGREREPKSVQAALQQAADLLDDQAESIAERWLERVRIIVFAERPVSDAIELRNTALLAVRAIAEALRHGRQEACAAAWSEPARQQACIRQQLSLHDLVREHQMLREEAWHALQPRVVAVSAAAAYAVLERLNLAFDTMAAVATDSYEAERQRLLQEVQRWATELNATMDAVADALVIYGPEGEIVRMNATAERLLGYSSEERGRPPARRAAQFRLESTEGTPVPPERMPVQRALHGETVRGVVMALHRADRVTWLSVSAAPIRSAQGEVPRIVATFTDVTAQHDLQQQEETLLRAVSHDLRSPLTAILGQAELLTRFAARPERVCKSAESISTSGRRMNAMIQDLVDSARLEAGQIQLHREPVALYPFVTALLERLKGTRTRERVRVQMPASLPPVYADPDRLERILVNLLSNALKYSQAEVLVRATRRNGEVVIAVTDHGAGIAPEDLPHLFERYYRTGAARGGEGLGLGLYITYLLVEAHGGHIWAQSAPGAGSTFSFTLPVSLPAAGAAPQQRAGAEPGQATPSTGRWKTA